LKEQSAIVDLKPSHINTNGNVVFVDALPAFAMSPV
jgi:hypothetical protein